MWSPKPPAVKTYIDYSENLQKAKIQASVLQRQKRIPAIVDFVKSGSRFTILVPRENAKLTLVLSGIRAPRSARNPTEKPEPFGQEAHDFAVRRCMQRDVEIDIETTDKVGGFIGTLYVNRENFAKLLLLEGLATVHEYSAEQSGNATELFAAEEKAKEGRKGIWHDHDPTKDLSTSSNQGSTNEQALPTPSSSSAADAGNTNGTPTKQDYRDALISHIDSATCTLKLQLVSPTTTTPLASLMSAFRTFHLSPSSSAKSLSGPPKAGDYVAAKFSLDGEWYRARIRRNDRENKRADVLFFDYGNSELVPWDSLRPLEPQDKFGTRVLTPQAVDGVMSGLRWPARGEYLADAVQFLEDRISGREVVLRVHGGGEGGTPLQVTVFEGEVDVNGEAVGEGLAMVATEDKVLLAKQEEAKKERRGVWEYGDLTED